MCSLCGDLSGLPHWADAGPDAAGDPAVRRRHRTARTAHARRLLAAHGLTLQEWQGRYAVGSTRGRTVLVGDLAGCWVAAETLLGRPVDPLGAGAVAALGGSAP